MSMLTNLDLIRRVPLFAALTHAQASPRQNIAKMVGASREMVSRVMKDFEEQGFMEILADGALQINQERRANPF